MEWVLFTALAVGSATLLGAGIGFCINRVPDRVRNALSGSSAGIMLYSALFGLILPASQSDRFASAPILAAGILTGALFLSAVNRLSPRLFRFLGLHADGTARESELRATVMFIAAMGIHHFPEGIAAGVSFGTGKITDVIAVAGGIALQNIPEGMVTVRPMLSIGMSGKKAAFLSVLISLIESLGVLIGYCAITVSAAVLPFLLCFAAGTMLFVLFSDMIPSSCAHEFGKLPVYAALGGFCMMQLLCAMF